MHYKELLLQPLKDDNLENIAMKSSDIYYDIRCKFAVIAQGELRYSNTYINQIAKFSKGLALYLQNVIDN